MKNAAGRVGYVPRNYVQRIPDDDVEDEDEENEGGDGGGGGEFV